MSERKKVEIGNRKRHGVKISAKREAAVFQTEGVKEWESEADFDSVRQIAKDSEKGLNEEREMILDGERQSGREWEKEREMNEKREVDWDGERQSDRERAEWEKQGVDWET